MKTDNWLFSKDLIFSHCKVALRLRAVGSIPTDSSKLLVVEDYLQVGELTQDHLETELQMKFRGGGGGTGISLMR